MLWKHDVLIKHRLPEVLEASALWGDTADVNHLVGKDLSSLEMSLNNFHVWLFIHPGRIIQVRIITNEKQMLR